MGRFRARQEVLGEIFGPESISQSAAFISQAVKPQSWLAEVLRSVGN
jgi:hypothetical protein